jgi:hypothetical protein
MCEFSKQKSRLYEMLSIQRTPICCMLIVLCQRIDKRDRFHSILQHQKENLDLILTASFFFFKLFLNIYIYIKSQTQHLM